MFYNITVTECPPERLVKNVVTFLRKQSPLASVALTGCCMEYGYCSGGGGGGGVAHFRCVAPAAGFVTIFLCAQKIHFF